MKSSVAAIKGIASYVPAGKLTNEALALEFPEWDAEKISRKTGIRVRGVAAENECASDLGRKAAEKLFSTGVCRPGEIDFLLFCTESPDYLLPPSACLLQNALGLSTSCGALDFNLGCSGFVYGLSLAKGMIETGAAGNVLLITAETYSKHINKTDRSVRTIFGDGAAAALVSGVSEDFEPIGPFVFGTDGSGAGNLIVPAGGMRTPCSAETSVEEDQGDGVLRSRENLYMNGPEIFNFTIKAVPSAINALLDKANVPKEDIDYFVFHQANQFMLEHLRKKMKIPPDKFCINLESYGNTVSATIPIALEKAAEQGRVSSGARVLLAGFGVGYSWATALLRWV